MRSDPEIDLLVAGRRGVSVSGAEGSHELRLTTPQNLPVHGTVGLFIQRQLHDIFQQYVMPGYGFTNPHGDPNSSTPNPAGLAANLSIPTLANTIWLTDEQRVDRDKAVFFQGVWDITSQLSLTGSLRYFWYKNSLQGFYGDSLNYDNLAGFSWLIGPWASSGTNLPITPKFKSNIVGRYKFEEIAGWVPFAQASWAYQSKSTPSLRVDNSQVIGVQRAYGLFDLATGVDRDNMHIQLTLTNATDTGRNLRALWLAR